MTAIHTSDPWVKCLNPNPQASVRLFCFPHAGAGASIFRNWSNLLPSSVEVCAVQLPGRENRLREMPFTHLLPLVQTLTQFLRPYLTIPFAFFGHSMGALISFELACQLRDLHQPRPVHLFVSGRRAPQISDGNPLIHALPASEFLEELRRFNGIPQKVLESAEFMQLLLPILRADFSICGTYTCTNRDPLDCPISAFAGIEDPQETSDLIEGWKAQTHSSFSLQMLPGNHFFLHTNQQLLLKMISDKLLEGSVLDLWI